RPVVPGAREPGSLMPRATWKGSLKISLVAIPIKVFPATDTTEGITFNQLHGSCQSRVQQRKWCPNCTKEVAAAEIVKGYEFERGRYVTFSDQELDTVKPTSTKVIDLVQFAPAAALDPIYVAKSYYLVADGDRGAEAFAVIAQALRRDERVG